MNYIIGKSWEELQVEIPKNIKEDRWVKTKCPNCEKIGKTNWKDKCLAIHNNYAKCHKCGVQYIISDEEEDNEEPKEYTLPVIANKTELSDEGLQFFIDRKIAQEVVINLGILQGRGSIIFPYYRKGVLTKYKVRGIKEKKFFQSKDSEPIIYNYDGCIGKKNIAILEGEGDVMATLTAFSNSKDIQEEDWGVTSVDQGAPNPTDSTYEKKLACLTNCEEIFSEAELIYVAVDNDTNGKILRDYLIKRYGYEKCKIVDWGKYKDTNEALMYEGKEWVLERILNAKDPKVSGAFTLDDVWDDVLNMYDFGLTKGSTTHMQTIDKYFTWRMGEVNLWSGYSNEGKSQFFHYLCLLKAKYDGWKSAFFSSENMPVALFYEDLIHTFVGKSLDKDLPMDFRAKREDVINTKPFINKHFFVNYPKESYTIEQLFEGFRYFIRKYGVKIVSIDPYNEVEHDMKPGEREDLYISRFMAKLKRFAVDHNVSVNLVAHQNSPERYSDGEMKDNFKKPNLYRIKGGGTFPDKADNVVVVHRPFRATDPLDCTVNFYSDKIKKRKLTGTVGGNNLDGNKIIFDYKSNRYLEAFNCQEITDNKELKRMAVDPLAFTPQNNFPKNDSEELIF